MREMECTLCPAGTYYAGGACVECPSNSSSDVGAAALSACRCDAGHYRVESSNGTSCQLCPAGTFERAGVCVACGRGASSPPGVSDPAACQCNASACQLAVWGWDCEGACEAAPASCNECAPGHFKDFVSSVGNTEPCDACGTSTYQPGAGASTCVACASTEAHVRFAQTNVSSCECVAGHEPTGESSEPCRPCARGYFKPARGDFPCQACPVGSFADAEGMHTCSQCALATADAYVRGANTTELVASTSITNCTCAAGLFESNGACVLCVPGSFKTTKGLHQCSFCGAMLAHLGSSFEHYHGSSEAGATSDSHCSPCPQYAGQNASLVGPDGEILDD